VGAGGPVARQDANPNGLPWLLRRGSQRRGEDATHNAANERLPINH